MGLEAEEAIRTAIAGHGPISFAEFMELSLYGPGGFYGGRPVGTSGHFVTSPHVHPIFASLLVRAIRELHESLGTPSPLRVVEVGAGDGALARQLLGELGDLPCSYGAVERSTEALSSLREIPGVETTSRLDLSGAHVVLAHELLDNLPFRVLRGSQEVRIGVDGDRFVEVLTDAPDELVPFAGEGETIVPIGALSFIDDLAAGLADAPAYSLIIDYGGVGEPGGPLHGYKDHRIVEDVLASPGDTDITAGVDFALISDRARERGMTAFPTVTQHAALLALGFEEWFRDELSRQHAQIDVREGIAALRTWSGRSSASLLVDPGALGRLRWLLLATPGLPQPEWLTRALNDDQERVRPKPD